MKYLAPVVALVLFCSELSAQTVVRGPYLQSPTPHSIIVRWRTDSINLCNARVYYGTDKNNLTQYVDSPSLVMEHHVTISGLQPFTKYYYTIGTSTTVLDGPDFLQYFVTQPLPGTVQPIRVWCIGDFGKASAVQKKVRDSYLHFADSTQNPANVWLWLGDNAYQNGTDQQFQTEVFDSISGYYHMFKYMPFMPSPGNHDYQAISPPPGNDPTTQTGPYFDIVDVPTHGEAGGVPSGTELYYSYDYGNIHFLSLNSEIGSNTVAYDWTGAFTSPFNGSPFTTWLDSDLAANTKQWTIAYWHQLPYSAGDVNSDDAWEFYMTAMRKNINPILERHGVDLVVCGHDHDYQRSYLINGHYGVSSTFLPTMLISGTSGNYDAGTPYRRPTTGPNSGKGTVYVCSGNAGTGNSNRAVIHPALYFGDCCDTCNGSFIIDVNGGRLDGKYLRWDNKILDQFTILKGDANGIEEPAPVVNSLKVYPNPFVDQADISFTLTERADYTIQVSDVTGKNVKTLYQNTGEAGEQTWVLNANQLKLAKGTYIIKVTSGNHAVSERMISIQN